MPNIPFLTLIIAGVIFTIVGFIMRNNPSRHINYWYGYRTGASMRNQARWNFSQVYAAKELIKIGVVLILLSWAACIYHLPETVGIVAGALIVFGSAIFLIVRVEAAIMNKFER